MNCLSHLEVIHLGLFIIEDGKSFSIVLAEWGDLG